MRSKAPDRNRKKGNRPRASMRFVMALQPRRSLARWKTPKITRHSRQQSLRIMTLSPPSSANLYCNWPVSCGGCGARRRWRPVYSKFKPIICRAIGQVANFYRILQTLFIPCFDEFTLTIR